MKREELVDRPPILEATNVREALELLRGDLLTVHNILRWASCQLRNIDETSDKDDFDWQARAAFLGMENTFDLCSDFLIRKVNETDSIYMNKLPAGSPPVSYF